jgi:osmoprotectant transport system substrate-binding protein
MLVRRLLVICLLALVPAVAACERGAESAPDRSSGGDAAITGPIERDPANAKVTLTIGSKNFTEQRVLAQIYAQGLQAAGYRVRTRLDLGDESAALRAVKGGAVDAYPEYTGTALLSFFGVRAAAIPKDPTEAYERAREGFAKQGLTAFEPTPFTSSNEVAVTQATAEREGLQRISDLTGRAKDLTLFGSPECDRRQDCLLGLGRSTGSSSSASSRSRSRSATTCSRTGARTCRSSSRPIRRSSARASSCSKTTAGCFLPTTPRSSCAGKWPSGPDRTCARPSSGCSGSSPTR